MDSSETTVQSNYSAYRDVIRDLLSGKEQLPYLPSITFEIRSAMEQQDLSMSELGRLLAKDVELSAVLLKYASSPVVGAQHPPNNLLDVIRLLGMNQVERITMVHSVKSLFSAYSVKHKRLYLEAWRRLALKASVSTYIAKHMHLKHVLPDNVLMAALLSEVGALAVMSAFHDATQTPDVPAYIALCREYAKSLSVITLKQWRVDEQYIKAAQEVGDWAGQSPGGLNLGDVINLGLYHSLKLSNAVNDLPPLQELTAYQKLEAPDNSVVAGGLTFVMSNVQEIKIVAKSLF